MANKILITEMDGTPAQISFADHSGDFSPTASNDLEFGTPTDCQIVLASLTDTNAVQSDKVDLGANRAQVYKVRAAFEFTATPAAGDLVELYWSPSSSSTAATGNPGGVTGSSSAYAGYSSNLEDSAKQLDLIGVFVCTVQTTPIVQIGEIGMFTPSERYGTLVVKNESNASFHSDDVESHIVFDPIVPESQ
jgi:hypothetical protein